MSSEAGNSKKPVFNPYSRSILIQYSYEYSYSFCLCTRTLEYCVGFHPKLLMMMAMMMFFLFFSIIIIHLRKRWRPPTIEADQQLLTGVKGAQVERGGQPGSFPSTPSGNTSIADGTGTSLSTPPPWPDEVNKVSPAARLSKSDEQPDETEIPSEDWANQDPLTFLQPDETENPSEDWANQDPLLQPSQVVVPNNLYVSSLSGPTVEARIASEAQETKLAEDNPPNDSRNASLGGTGQAPPASDVALIMCGAASGCAFFWVTNLFLPPGQQPAFSFLSLLLAVAAFSSLDPAYFLETSGGAAGDIEAKRRTANSVRTYVLLAFFTLGVVTELARQLEYPRLAGCSAPVAITAYWCLAFPILDKAGLTESFTWFYSGSTFFTLAPCLCFDMVKPEDGYKLCFFCIVLRFTFTMSPWYGKIVAQFSLGWLLSVSAVVSVAEVCVSQWLCGTSIFGHEAKSIASTTPDGGYQCAIACVLALVCFFAGCWNICDPGLAPFGLG